MKFFLRKRGDEVKERIQAKYEVVMLYIIVIAELVTDLYVIFYPLIAPVAGVLILASLAGGVDTGGKTIEEIIYNICISLLVFSVLYLLYFYFNKVRRKDIDR